MTQQPSDLWESWIIMDTVWMFKETLTQDVFCLILWIHINRKQTLFIVFMWIMYIKIQALLAHCLKQHLWDWIKAVLLCCHPQLSEQLLVNSTLDTSHCWMMWLGPRSKDQGQPQACLLHTVFSTCFLIQCFYALASERFWIFRLSSSSFRVN